MKVQKSRSVSFGPQGNRQLAISLRISLRVSLTALCFIPGGLNLETHAFWFGARNIIRRKFFFLAPQLDLAPPWITVE